MPYKLLIADDDEGQRKAHGFAIDMAKGYLNEDIIIVEARNSVDAWKLIQAEKFDLIILDNDFKDDYLKGHLPGLALLERATKDGINKTTPVFFCSIDSFDTVKGMVNRYGGKFLSKTDYDVEEVAHLFATALKHNPG
jgi:CheY-like chemotaxis protein